MPAAVVLPAVVGVPAEFPCKCVVDDAADDASTAASSEIADAGVTDRVLDDFDETVKRWADIKNFLGKVPWADLTDSEDDDWSFLDAGTQQSSASSSEDVGRVAASSGVE